MSTMDNNKDVLSKDTTEIQEPLQKIITIPSPDNTTQDTKIYPDVVVGLPLNPPDITPDNSTVIPCVFDCSEHDIKYCRKCKRAYCIRHANRFSPNFCQDCFGNLSVIEGKFHRIFEYYNEETDEVVHTKESCTRYYMDGPDWPFLVAWINKLTDEELMIVWNFHFFVMKQIEAENETRKIKRFQKLRESPTPTLVKQTVSKSKSTIKQPDTPEEIRKKLKKQGLADSIIDMMIKAMNP